LQRHTQDTSQNNRVAVTTKQNKKQFSSSSRTAVISIKNETPEQQTTEKTAEHQLFQ
jgi:hypothetical protein